MTLAMQKLHGAYEKYIIFIFKGQIPSSCIEMVANMEDYELLMDQLKVTSLENNRFIYESNEPCVIPDQTSTNGDNMGSHEGATGTPGTEAGTAGSFQGRNQLVWHFA